METKEDTSYGIIPVLKEGNIWKVFLINQYGSTGDVYWTFPKGHPEGDESPKEAALRELFEETHIVPAQVLEDKIYTQEYTFIYEDALIKKRVQYYLGIAQSSDFFIQKDEVKEAGWFSPDEVLSRLTYEHALDMFLVVLNYMKVSQIEL